uniref:alpha-N-acetylgalactosaminide alpha-2,6-sialyltransferase n=1 Tax=Astyanax mexicanus TaxID=7994 RepID=W5LEL7_ASTMX
MRKLLPAAVSLLCCGVFYLIIWRNISGSPQTVYLAVLRSGSFWRDGLETGEVTEALVTPDKNSSFTTKLTTVKTLKEDFKSLQHENLTQTETPAGNKTQTLQTPSVLFKKDYTRLPQWNFEDVYVRNNDEKRQVCSASLQNSRDPEFQAAVISDIQLWLYRGHLDISEWNRLSHFNNPFGFMDYRYNDIKPAADLIPKPRSTQLLPVPEGAQDGCIRCAVVGTGGILSGSRMGKEIDSHHYVFRMNGALIKGYEEDVGKRTSVYVHTSYAILNSFFLLKPYGFEVPKDEGIKYVLIPEGQRDFEWIEGLMKKKLLMKGTYNGFRPLSFYSGGFDEDKLYVLHPDFLRYVRNRFLRSTTLDTDLWYMFRPTNGAFTLFLALHTCDIVDVYGFITEDHHKYNNYYFERSTKTSVVFFVNHDYNLEIQTWKKLHDAGIINLYQRKENPNGT